MNTLYFLEEIIKKISEIWTTLWILVKWGNFGSYDIINLSFLEPSKIRSLIKSVNHSSQSGLWWPDYIKIKNSNHRHVQRILKFMFFSTGLWVKIFHFFSIFYALSNRLKVKFIWINAIKLNSAYYNSKNFRSLEIRLGKNLYSNNWGAICLPKCHPDKNFSEIKKRDSELGYD